MRALETLLAIQTALTGGVLLINVLGHLRQRKDMRELLNRKTHIRL